MSHLALDFLFNICKFFNFLILKKIVHVSSHNCVICQCHFVVILFLFIQFSLYIRYLYLIRSIFIQFSLNFG